MTSEELDSTLRAFQENRILLTAVELNVFTAIGSGATAGEVAARVGAAPRAVAALLNALTAMELLEKEIGAHGEGHFRNSPLAAVRLVDSSPTCDRAAMLHDANRWHTWTRLTSIVRGEVPPEEHRTLDTGRHRDLLTMLDRKAVERAPKLVDLIGTSGVSRVLDIGGGSAAYSIAFVRAGPGTEADVFELPEVLPLTREYVLRAGEEDRVHLREGDLLRDEFVARDRPAGYDLILLFSITHLVNEAENRDLFTRCHRALAPGGRLAIHDHVLNDLKTSPRAGAIFALNMLVATREGGTYSFAEYEAWLRDAGFSSVEQRALPGAPTAVLLATR